jgi:epoxyqueuosine reductase
MSISQNEIKARASHLGFSFVGFTPAVQTPHFPQYVDFVANHTMGDLAFLSQSYVNKGREDPTSLLENAKSVIVLGVCYPSFNSQIGHNNTDGIISAYAVLPDYHKIIKEKAIALMKEIEQISTARIDWRIFIDSGPMMEKDMAFAAGLGGIGKHSLCIHPDFGSFFFICCILTNLDITQMRTIPVKDLCGNCTLCEQACPTQCIDDHHIDVTRCISYLTTGHKGIIPRDRRSQLGLHVFGCDVCQTVCPYNKSSITPENGYYFHTPHAIPASLKISEELNHTPHTFKEKYNGTPILKIGFERYLRNIIIAAGNSMDVGCVPALKRLISHDSDLVGIHAVWAYNQLSDINLNRYLRNLLDTEISELVAAEIRALVSE